MTIELHHLHPSHDDELTRLKARIAELEKENQTLAEDVSDKIESITELTELVEKYKSEKGELAEIYLKSEADRVIAEKDKEIEQLQAMLEERNKQVGELKERSQWHRQKDKDIYFECGKHWGAEYIIKMKDGTTHLAYGGCDEGGDGSVSTFLHFQEDDDFDNDYEWEYDDIDMWYEIPDPKIDGNIKEADNGLG